jgi:predicted aspartyl protease
MRKVITTGTMRRMKVEMGKVDEEHPLVSEAVAEAEAATARAKEREKVQLAKKKVEGKVYLKIRIGEEKSVEP